MIYEIRITRLDEGEQHIERKYAPEFFNLSSDDGWKHIVDMFDTLNDGGDRTEEDYDREFPDEGTPDHPLYNPANIDEKAVMNMPL